MKNTIFTVLGFAFLLTGFIALILSLVGVRLVMLAFLDLIPSPGSFIAKIVMIMIGIVLIYVGKSDEILH